MINPTLAQSAFRGRDDSQALNGTSFTRALNTAWTQDTGAVFRVRFVIQETAGAAIASAYQIQYDLNGSDTWIDVTTGTPVQLSASSQFAHLTPTSAILGVGSGTFTAGQGISTANLTNSISLAASGFTEIEVSLRLDAAQLATGNTIRLRVAQSGGGALASYTNTPTITANVLSVTHDLASALDGAGDLTSPSLEPPPPFADPTSLADLSAWYDPNRGLWKNGSRTEAATEHGDLVYAWDDQSGNGFHLEAHNLFAIPTLAILSDGRKVVRFRGGGFRRAFVGPTNVLAGGHFTYLLDASLVDYTSASETLLHLNAGDTTPRITLHKSGSGNNIYQQVNAASAAQAFISTATLASAHGDWLLIAGRYDQITNRVTGNGVSDSAALTEAMSATTEIRVGWWRDGTPNELNADIGHVALYNRALTAQEEADLAAWALAERAGAFDGNLAADLDGAGDLTADVEQVGAFDGNLAADLDGAGDLTADATGGAPPINTSTYAGYAQSLGAVLIHSQSRDATTWFDESGGSRDGTINGATWNATGGPDPAMPGYFAFDGIDDSVDVGNPAALQFAGAHTLVWWERSDGLAQGTSHVQKIGKGNDAYSARVNGTTINSTLYNVRTAVGSGVQAIANTGITPNTWQMFMARYTGTAVELWEIAAGVATLRASAAFALSVYDDPGNFGYGGQHNLGAYRRWWRGDIAGASAYPSSITTSDFEALYDRSVGNVADVSLASDFEGFSDEDAVGLDLIQTPEADLDGDGDLGEVEQTAVLRVLTDLDGDGDLSVSLGGAQTLDSALDGSGDLSVTAARVQALDADLDGSGDLTSALRRTARLTANADGAGNLTAAIRSPAEGAELRVSWIEFETPRSSLMQILDLAANLDGSGDLNTINVRAARPLASDLDGSGDLTSAITRAALLAGALDGSGDLTALLVRAQALSASLDGAGDLTAAITRAAHLSAALDGAGDLTAAQTRAQALSASLDGAGDLAAILVRASALSASLDGAGDITAAIVRAQRLTGALDGAGDLSAAVRRAALLASALDGAGDVTIAAIRRTALLASALDGSGDLTAAATRAALLASALDGSGDLTSDLTRLAYVGSDIDDSIGDMTAAIAVVSDLAFAPAATLASANLVDQDGLSANLHAAVSDSVEDGMGDATYIVNTQPETATALLALSSPPSDLALLRSLRVRVRARRQP